jgi:hypothetical protein
MTIYRSDLVDTATLKYQFVSSNEPDLIGVEVMSDDNVLFEVSMNQYGQTTVQFEKEAGQMEFTLKGLREVLNKCENELTEWRNRLLLPNGVWETNQ